MKKNRTLPSWEKREGNLKKIKRYGKFSVMFYRTDLSIYSKRVSALLEVIIPFVKNLYPDFDIKKAKLIAKYHDDFETVLKGGDISLQLKLMMNESEMSELKRKEVLAVDQISTLYPQRIRGYNYKQLLLHVVFKDCIEAQAVSFVDKIDGYCEAIHEILAGNVIFVEPVINYYSKTFNDLPGHFPLIKKVFLIDNDLFSFPVVDLIEFFQGGKIGSHPHDPASIRRKTGIPHYEVWKKVTIKKIGIEQLITQLEFQQMYLLISITQ
ncbi:MAG: YfbR-like 5'-deoxynucleotidase [Candidatus Paceibacterota bacterium]|jgi:hypothetical protein